MQNAPDSQQQNPQGSAQPPAYGYGQPMPPDGAPQPPAYGYGQPPTYGRPMPPYGLPQPPSGQQPMMPYGQATAPYGQPMMPYGQPMPFPPQRKKAYDHPVIATVLTILQYFAYSIVAGFILLIPFFFGSLSESHDTTAWLMSISLILQMFIGIAMGVVYQFRNRDSFDGMLGWAWPGLVMVLPVLGFVASNLYEGIAGGLSASTPLPVAIALAFSPGFAEEIVFRAIPCSNWMRVRDDEGSVIPCVLVTSLAFGLTHITNLAGGASLSSTLFQLVYATALGVLFSAVFLRCGSIWPCVIAHTAIDATAFAYMDFANMGIVSEDVTVDGTFLFAAAATVAILVFGLVLVRPSVRGRISALWSAKWHKGRPWQG